ncbi:MAG: transketolase [Lachnospiraceae bacterium]|nr:transketolase [Lachnospiraceae bacterium]
MEILISIICGASNFAVPEVPTGDRDILVVSKGHAALAQYAVMNEAGLIGNEFIKQYQKNGSDYPEELMKDEKLRIECSTGSLGIGLPYAVGRAIFAKRRRRNQKIFCLVGDGECDEGSVWEAIMLAAQQKLNNMVLVVDLNGLQADGNTEEIITWNNMKNQMESFGWTAVQVDGHDFKELQKAFQTVTDKPLAILAKTIKGKGISFMEGDYSWHDRVLNKKLLEQAKAEIGL